MDHEAPLEPAAFLPAAWEEMRFFDAILADHGRVIRSILDWGEDERIRRGDGFAAAFAALEEEVSGSAPPVEEGAWAVVAQTAVLTGEFLAFKRELFALLEECRVHAVFEPVILDHLRREAVWYLGMLGKPLGQPAPFRRELGLPDGQTRAALVPRRLIGRLPVSLNVVSLEYGLFWLHLHEEHAALLKTHTRPETQRRLHRILTSWEADLGGLRHEGERLFSRLAARQRLAGSAPDPEVARFNRRLTALMVRWRDFLRQLTEDLRSCRVPTGQANFPPAMTDHLRREADYLLDALQRIAQAGRGTAG